MSFDLAVLAMDGTGTVADARRMFERCRDLRLHDNGEPDVRIVGFYEALRAAYPDDRSAGDDSPWMAMPLEVATDHVVMSMSWSASDLVVDTVRDLARRYGLVLYDPQDDQVYFPAD